MSTTRKILLTVAILGAVGTVAGLGTFAAFTGTESNIGNQFAAGTLLLDDTPTSSPSLLYSVTAARPSQSTQRCVAIKYAGTITGGVPVALLSPTDLNAEGDALSPHITLLIEQSQAATSVNGSDCSGFGTAIATPTYSGTLFNFLAGGATPHTNFASGISVNPSATDTQWDPNDVAVFRFTTTLSNTVPDSQQGKSTGSHEYTWATQLGA